MHGDNEVKNIVRLIGNSKSIKKAMGELIIEEDRFTFDSFAPIPDELMYTDPTQLSIPDKDYEKILRSYKDRLDSGGLEDYESIPISHYIQKRFIHEYGYDNWYDWAMNHWGCKAQPYDTTIISDNEFSFHTPNATPHTAMVKMSMKYPKIEFQVRYADEDLGYNVGEYSLLNGETIATNVPPSDIFNKDSVVMAHGVLKDDYYLREIIYELSDREVIDSISGKDKYLNVLLQAILEFEIVDEEYPREISVYLLESAVSNEQYEYAATLKKLLDSEVAGN